MTHSYGDSCVHDYESIKDIMNRGQKNVDSGGNKKVSCHQYYCYKLQIRDDKSILLYFGYYYNNVSLICISNLRQQG